MILRSDLDELNVGLKFRIDGFDYVVFAPSNKMKCIGCGQEGHVRRACPERANKSNLPGQSGENVCVVSLSVTTALILMNKMQKEVRKTMLLMFCKRMQRVLRKKLTQYLQTWLMFLNLLQKNKKWLQELSQDTFKSLKRGKSQQSYLILGDEQYSFMVSCLAENIDRVKSCLLVSMKVC